MYGLQRFIRGAPEEMNTGAVFLFVVVVVVASARTFNLA